MARERVDDLVVVLPGILGSRLLDADGKECGGRPAARYGGPSTPSDAP
ncbi:hypothetical protein [Streptomyces sirii]